MTLKLSLLSCAGLPKLSFALRRAPPRAISSAVAAFQSSADRVLESILGDFSIPPEARSVLHLKPSRDGLGVPLASLRADLAFFCSVAQSLPLQDQLLPASVPRPRPEYDSCLLDFAATYGPVSTAQIQSHKNPQAWLSDTVDAQVPQDLLASGSVADKARLLSKS